MMGYAEGQQQLVNQLQAAAVAGQKPEAATEDKKGLAEKFRKPESKVEALAQTRAAEASTERHV